MSDADRAALIWRHPWSSQTPSLCAMAVDVDTSGSAVRLGVPHALFSAVGARVRNGPYDVTADGRKFLINSGDVKESSEPMMLVQNWPAELKR